jgi:hypothetical protein
VIITEDKTTAFPCDLAIVVGVKNLDLLHKYRAINIPVVYFDKAYDRADKNMWRVSFNDHQPTDYMRGMPRCDDARRLKFGWKFDKWKTGGRYILFAGSGNKYHTMKGLGNATEYATRMIRLIREITDRPIVYRPKPSFTAALPIEGSIFSRAKHIGEDLRDTFCLVTYGSNACFNALQSGVPSIVLGDGVTRDISSNSLMNINNPRLATGTAVDDLLSKLAYFQWSYDEISDGTFLKFIKREMRL